MGEQKLARELRAEALLRMEKAARTESDYIGVEKMWDKLDGNRERRERYHEISCPHATMDRAPDAYWHDFLDLVMDSAEWYHHIIEDADPSTAVLQLSAKQKDLLYLHKVRYCSVTQIALLKGQSSRNIRKMKVLLLQKIQAVLGFVNQYGLPGFMTALPTTPDFMDFDVVYLPKNSCIETDTMPCLEYIELFFPFEKLNIVKNENGVSWTASGNEAVALQMTMNNVPLAASLIYHRAYSEPYEWVKAELKNWAFMLMTSAYFYKEKDKTMRELYQKGLYAFGGIAPGYHIILEEDKPIIVWDFQALMRVAQMAISYAITNENKPLRVCKGCGKAFIGLPPQPKNPRRFAALSGF